MEWLGKRRKAWRLRRPLACRIVLDDPRRPQTACPRQAGVKGPRLKPMFTFALSRQSLRDCHGGEHWRMRMIKPIGRLVPVSFKRCRSSTPGLSTWWSTTALIGSTRFEVSFPLRCLQRLSSPYIATLHCGWRHNRSTRGTSTPVLSY